MLVKNQKFLLRNRNFRRMPENFTYRITFEILKMDTRDNYFYLTYITGNTFRVGHVTYYSVIIIRGITLTFSGSKYDLLYKLNNSNCHLSPFNLII